jgi:centrosomal protein CEP290
MESDDKLLIGKLHHHILALQMSEATALRKLDSAHSKCLRLENQVVQYERTIDEKDKRVFSMQQEYRNSLKGLYKSLAESRIRIAGQVTLEKYEVLIIYFLFPFLFT